MQSGIEQSPRVFPCMRTMIATIVALIALSCATTTAAGGGTNRTVQVDGKDVPAEQVAKDLVDDANVAARNHRDSDAKQMFTRVTTEFSDTSSFGPASVGLAHLQMDGGDAKSAQATLEKLLLQDPTTSVADEARYLLALAQLQQGDSRSAAPTLKSLVDKMPEAEKADGLSKLGHQLYSQGAGTEAARYLARAIEANAADKAQCEKELFSAVDGMIPFADLRVLLETEAKPNTMFDELLTMKLARVHLHLRDYASSNDMVQRYLQRYPSGRFAKVAVALRDQLAARVVVDAKVVGVLLPLTGEYSAYGKRALSAVKLGFGLPVKAEEKPPEPELDPATGMPIKKDDDDQPKPPPKKQSLEETLRSPSGLTIIIRDTAGDANKASAEVKELVDKNHAIAILGDILLDTSLPAALAAEDAGVPMLSLSRRDGVPEAGPWTFRLALTAKKQAQALASLAVDGIGLKHFAIVYPKYAFGVELMNSMWDELEKRQVEVTAVESYAVDQTTFTQEAKALVGRGMQYSSDVGDCRRDAQNITNEYRRGKALEACNDLAKPVVDFEALFIPDSYKNVSYVVPALVAEDVLLTNERHVVQNYKKTIQGSDNVKPVQLLGVNMWNDPELTKRFGKHEIDGAIFVDGFDVNSGEPRVQKFVQAFSAAHSGRPQLVEAQSFDGASLFNAILTGAAGETPKSREQMRQALQGVKDFPGVTGNVSFDAQGDSVTQPRFFQVEGDRVEAKDPAVIAKQENAG
jgi:ABC-type branched-subunit amino acid transport system substrate-binding protein/TolA-binding protein